MSKAKLNFDEVLQRLNEDRLIRAKDVKTSVLSRKVWVSYNRTLAA